MTDQGQATGSETVSKTASGLPNTSTSVRAITLSIFSLLTQRLSSPADPCSGCSLRQQKLSGPQTL